LIITAKTASVNFPSTGTWHSYLTKTSINVTSGSANLTLQPGEYHVYLNKDLSSNLVTAITSPALPVLNARLRIHPNPVVSSATISYTIPTTGKIKLTLVDEVGNNIITLYDGLQTTGNHSLKIPSSTINILQNRSGIHVLLLRTGSGQQAIKFLLPH